MKQDQGWALVPNKVIKGIGDAVGADVKTIRRVINGQPVRPVKATKIQQALAVRGYPFGEVNVAVLPVWSKRIKAPAPRKMRPEYSARPQSLGAGELSLAERTELEVIEAELSAAGVSRVRPRTLADCPPEGSPCPWVSCRYHLALDVLPNNYPPHEGQERRTEVVIKANWPGLDVDEIPETCSLRVAARAARNKPLPGVSKRGMRLPVLSCEEIGRLMNSTQEQVRTIENQAIAKLEALAAELAPA